MCLAIVGATLLFLLVERLVKGEDVIHHDVVMRNIWVRCGHMCSGSFL